MDPPVPSNRWALGFLVLASGEVKHRDVEQALAVEQGGASCCAPDNSAELLRAEHNDWQRSLPLVVFVLLRARSILAECLMPAAQ